MTTPARILPLEARRLFSAVVAHVSFQPAWADERPAGFVVDAGNRFGPAEDGFSYGWDVTNDHRVRDRDVIDDARYDTLNHFGGSNPGQTWEFALADGDYSVRVVSGDPSYVDSHYDVQAEGVDVLNHIPTKADRWGEGVAVVHVSDGRLTLTSGPEAVNNKISFVSIRELDNPGRALPGAPTPFKALQHGATAARLAWGAAQHADAYQVELSTDGGAFARLGTLDGGDRDHTVHNLAPGHEYRFRVRAVNGFGDGAWSKEIALRIVPSGTAQPTQPTTPRDPLDLNGDGFVNGITLDGGVDPKLAIPRLKQLGIEAVRIWSDVDTHKLNAEQAWGPAKAYHAAGIGVTMCVDVQVVPTGDAATRYFDWLGTQPGLFEAVDRWEIANEPNLWQYWHGTLGQYVNDLLKPAYTSLHRAGELVVGGGVSEDVNALRTLRDLGYLNYVDYANFHPYGRSVEQQVQRIAAAKSIFAGKPLTLTEWNVHYRAQGRQAWTEALNTLRPWVKANVESAFYFNFHTLDTQAGPAGVFVYDRSANRLSENEFFFDTVASWNNN